MASSFDVYQGGSFVELLGTQGTNPLSQWKICGPQKNFQKIYDKEVKGSIYASTSGTVKLQLPKEEKTMLGLVQPYLVLQVSLSQGQPFTVELVLSDNTGARRRLIFSSSFSEAKITPLHSQVPFAAVARDTWLNLVIPMAEAVPLFFRGATFKSLDTLSISGSMRLRRVFSLRDAPYVATNTYSQADMLPLPRGLEFPAGVDVFSQVIDARAVASLGVQVGAHGKAPAGRTRHLTAIITDGSSDDDDGFVGLPPAAGSHSNSFGSVRGSGASGGSGSWAHAAPARQDQLSPTRLAARAGGATGAHVGWNPNATEGSVVRPGARMAAVQGAYASPGGRRPNTDSAATGLSPAKGGPVAGRRAVSAQLPLRTPDSTGRQGQAPGSGLPMSPPYPRAAIAQRAQTGPAATFGGDSSTAMLPLPAFQQLPDLPAPGSPQHATRYGRRAGAGAQIPSTIMEGQPMSPAAAAKALAGGHGAKAGAGLPIARTGSGLRNVSSPARGRPSPIPRPSPAGVRGASPAAKDPAGGLQAVLQVKAGVDTSLDFSAMVKDSHLSDDGLPPVGSPFLSSMVNIMQSVNLSRDRYAGQADASPKDSPTSASTKTSATVPAARAAASPARVPAHPASKAPAPPAHQRPTHPQDGTTRSARMGGEEASQPAAAAGPGRPGAAAGGAPTTPARRAGAGGKPGSPGVGGRVGTPSKGPQGKTSQVASPLRNASPGRTARNPAPANVPAAPKPSVPPTLPKPGAGSSRAGAAGGRGRGGAASGVGAAGRGNPSSGGGVKGNSGGVPYGAPLPRRTLVQQRSAASSIADVDESLTLMSGLDGFGVDEDDVLGSKHFHTLETIPDNTESPERPGRSSPSVTAFVGNAAAGSPMRTHGPGVLSPPPGLKPIRTKVNGVNHQFMMLEGVAGGTTPTMAAAGAVSSPAVRRGAQPLPPHGDALPLRYGAGVGVGGEASTVSEDLTTHPMLAQIQGGGAGQATLQQGPAQALSVPDGNQGRPLEEVRSMYGVLGGPLDLDPAGYPLSASYGGQEARDIDWAHVEQLVAPSVDMAAAGRIYTPPVIPASKVHAGAKAQGRPHAPQVLAVGQQEHNSDRGGQGVGGGQGAGGGQGVGTQDEMVDLVFDPVLRYYYDARTNTYFELK